MKKLLLIVNPKSGKGAIRSRLLDITDIFVKGKYDVSVYVTQESGDARRRTEQAVGDYDVIACSGGDGTLDEVISGMLDSGRKCTVGYIPAGSTNDFANSLGLPKNMLGAAKRIVEGSEVQFDIGSFNDDHFVYIAGFGLFTDVSYETDQNMKNALGHLAYLLEGAKKLASIKSYRLKARMDDREEIEGEFIFGMITNSTSVGGFQNITGKHVKMDDGVFEVTLVRKPTNLIEFQAILTAAVTQKSDDQYFFQTRAGSIDITFEEAVPWTLDGEFGGEHTEVHIRNLQKELTMLN